MTTHCDIRYPVHPEDYATYDARRIRERFLVNRLFTPGDINLTYTFYDRMVVGGALPADKPVALEPVDQLMRASYFLERREMGAINIGGKGTVIVDGREYELDHREALYIGRGSESVQFVSNDKANPAKFYLNSTPAHKEYPTTKVGRDDAEVVELGSKDTCNERALNKMLVNNIIGTCQLQMGVTEIKPGSVWNTMPAHRHSRRMEAYFYFNVAEDQAVCHFMGPPEDPRPIWVHNEQAVVSPQWSMHCGVGTANYIFIWGMGGENLDYGDMDFIQPTEMGVPKE